MKRIFSTPLDKYEQELEDFLSKGDYISSSKSELKKIKKIFEEAAENYFKRKKAGKLKISVQTI